MKRSIPRVPGENSPRMQFDNALKENVEIIIGQRGERIAELSPSATMSDLIKKTNEIIRLLQS